MATRGKKRTNRRLKDAQSRRHHYVPAGYLGFWADPEGRYGKLSVWRRETRSSFIKTPDNVAWERDLYRLDPGDPPHAIEEALAKAEGDAIQAIRDVRARPGVVPKATTVDSVLTFVALQFVRGPHFFAEFQRFTGSVSRMLLDLSTATPERYEAGLRRMHGDDATFNLAAFPSHREVREGLEDEKFEFQMNNGFVVTTLLKQQDTAFNLLSQMRLRFCWVEEGELLATSSRPVTCFPAPGVPPMMQGGLATAAAVTMPLTPHILFMATPGDPGVIAEALAPAMGSQNNRALGATSEHVYSRGPYEGPPALDAERS